MSEAESGPPRVLAVTIQAASQFVTVISVVVGVVISVWSFNETRQKENLTREKEAETAKIEAARPFLELRQNLYKEALAAAGVLANPNSHTADELAKAKKRFEELYVAELSMVETREVEDAMVNLAKQIDPEITRFTPAQSAAYALSKSLRAGFLQGYGLAE